MLESVLAEKPLHKRVGYFEEWITQGELYSEEHVTRHIDIEDNLLRVIKQLTFFNGTKVEVETEVV